MSTRAAGPDACDPDEARVHATLRFATGVTAAFVLCEALEWWPTFMAPVLAAVLLTNLPARPPMKVALVLTLSMSLAALFAYAMSSLLRATPTILLGLIALCVFLSFQAMLGGRLRVPALLLLVCLSTIPVVVMIAPAQAGILPTALIRGIALALLAIGCVHLAWPRILPRVAAPAAPPATSSLAMALLSTAIVMPLMLVYLLFGLVDALPVIVTTVLLVATFDLQRGRLQAGAMILGNFAGGILGLLLHSVLLVQPNLLFLALLLFVVLLWFGQRIAAGGSAAAVALITCNSMLIILSSAIAAGPGSLSVWLTRLFQFALAGAFAVGMMTLVLQRPLARTTAS